MLLNHMPLYYIILCIHNVLIGRIVIMKVMEDSQAAKTGLVNVGDEILQVYVYITCMYVPM